MKYPLSFLLLTLLFGKIGHAQQAKSPNDTLLLWIASKQVKADTFYQEGLFPSQRIGKKGWYEDNTLFYSALIANTLKSLSGRVSPEDAKLIDSIVLKVQKNTWRYRSRRGRATYNFWQTNPDIPHPNGPAKYQTEKYKIPDDFVKISESGISRIGNIQLLREAGFQGFLIGEHFMKQENPMQAAQTFIQTIL